MTLDQVDSVGQGRVWDGGTARQLRLVDEYGGMEEAFAWVARQAELGEEDWSPVYLGDDRGTADTILRQWLIGEEEAGGRDVFAMVSNQQRATAGMIILDAQRLLATSGIQAYCLVCPSPSIARAQAERGFDGFLRQVGAFLSD
jgi:protease-4